MASPDGAAGGDVDNGTLDSPELWADGNGALGSPELGADALYRSAATNVDDGTPESPELWADDGNAGGTPESPELWADMVDRSAATATDGALGLPKVPTDGYADDSPEPWADALNRSAATTVDDGALDSPELWANDAQWVGGARVAARRPDSPAPWADPAKQPTAAPVATTEWTTVDRGAGLRVYCYGQPHVDVRRSEALDTDGELGLFAATDFCVGATIGVYTGAEVIPGTVGPYVAKLRPERRGPVVWIDRPRRGAAVRAADQRPPRHGHARQRQAAAERPRGGGAADPARRRDSDAVPVNVCVAYGARRVTRLHVAAPIGARRRCCTQFSSTSLRCYGTRRARLTV